jgi:signal transduction histidine kinase
LPPRAKTNSATLRNAFEHMRASLQARMEELNRLLVVSRGAASSLTLGEALPPVLEAIVASGATSARIILNRDFLPPDTPFRFADGIEQDVYMHLDHQVVALTETQERVVMATVAGNRILLIDPNLPRPESLIALALRHENRYYGTLWAAYDKQHIFTESDLKFTSTLASQAALAVAKIRLFMTVETSRRQLEAILNSTPDPILVTDAANRLILANPAAGQALGVSIRPGERADTEKTIQVKALNDILRASSTEQLSAEIAMPDGRTYLAMTSPMIADEKITGRVCVLRDVTQLKEIDQLKSDFVATVSHDLRSPLTLMRGYATMLEMAGALNDQQKNYSRMIVQGVDNMAKLVNNLLDLGRIEFGVGLQVETVPVLDILERVTGELQACKPNRRVSRWSWNCRATCPTPSKPIRHCFIRRYTTLSKTRSSTLPTEARSTVQLDPQPNGSLIFAVQDSGIGISEEDRKRLFEKFYRGTNRDALMQRGTGLGLAIVKSIAERHGGKAWVESELGKGSVFFLQIP